MCLQWQPPPGQSGTGRSPMEMGTRGPDAPVEYGEKAEVIIPVEGGVRYGCCPKRCNKCCSHLPESLRPCCLPGQECCVNCCYNPGKLDQLYYGGFYLSLIHI